MAIDIDSDPSNDSHLKNKHSNTHHNHYEEVKILLRNFSVADNTLINLSAEMLAILTILPQQTGSHNLPELHQYLLKCMSQLHNRGLQADYPPRLMEKVCYALCAAFDEEIMNTSWGQSANWENHSLVAQLFQQRNAGEVFFIILEQTRQNTSHMIDFIELLYLLLRLGFKGQYQNADGHALAELTNSLYDDICKYRQPSNRQFLPALSKPWHPLKQSYPLRIIPILLVILLLAGVLTHFWIVRINGYYEDNLRILSHLSEPPSPSSASHLSMHEPSMRELSMRELSMHKHI